MIINRFRAVAASLFFAPGSRASLLPWTRQTGLVCTALSTAFAFWQGRAGCKRRGHPRGWRTDERWKHDDD